MSINRGGAPLNNRNAVKDGPTKEKFIILRATDEELSRIDGAAQARGVSRNVFMVAAALASAKRILKSAKANANVPKEKPGRSVQIPLRVIPAEQTLTDRAAAINGESRNAFMVNAAVNAARRTVRLSQSAR